MVLRVPSRIVGITFLEFQSDSKKKSGSPVCIAEEWDDHLFHPTKFFRPMIQTTVDFCINSSFTITGVHSRFAGTSATLFTLLILFSLG